MTDPGNPNALVPAPLTALCPTTTTGFCNQNVNIGKEVHEGVEVKVQSSLFSRLTVDGSYAYINRTINYDFSSDPNVSQVHTSIIILPTLPRNKLVGTATVRLIHQALAIVSARYEGGLTLQDTTYSSSSPLFKPFSESFGTMDIGAIVPVYQKIMVQVGIKNLLDRNYYYNAGYPEERRSWYVNLRYQF